MTLPEITTTGNDDGRQLCAALLKKLHEQDAAFTVDVLGEAVVSEKEAGDRS